MAMTDVLGRLIDSVGGVREVAVDLACFEEFACLALAVEEVVYGGVVEVIDPIFRAFRPDGVLGGDQYRRDRRRREHVRTAQDPSC